MQSLARCMSFDTAALAAAGAQDQLEGIRVISGEVWDSSDVIARARTASSRELLGARRTPTIALTSGGASSSAGALSLHSSPRVIVAYLMRRANKLKYGVINGAVTKVGNYY